MGETYMSKTLNLDVIDQVCKIVPYNIIRATLFILRILH